MRRRSEKTTKIIFWVISILVIASMLCGALATLLTPSDTSSIWPGLLQGAALL